MNRQESNGWLVYAWGETMRVAFMPSPWSAELAMVLLQPPVFGQEEVYATLLLPVEDPEGEVNLGLLQSRLGLTQQRAQHLLEAYREALSYYTSEAEAEPLQRVIPIRLA